MVGERINKVSCCISRSLYDEIKKAQSTLNSIEKQKCIGKKRKKYNFQETSHKIAIFLKSKRKEKKRMSSIFDDWF